MRKKKPTSQSKIRFLDLIQRLRKPMARGTVVFRDRKRYTRKQKHKKDDREEE